MRRAFLVVVLALSSVLVLTAQQSVSTDYVVGPHDVLSITVFNEPTLTGRYTVQSDGSINFPMIEHVQVGGKTVRQIQDELTKRLEAGYLRDPQVTVLVEQFRSQSVFIIGEVRQPGKHTIQGDLTLLEALSEAGGATTSAGTEVLVRRPKNPAGTTGPVDPTDDAASVVVARINLDDLQNGRTPNVTIKDGDTIFVPKADVFFVIGYVRSPGTYVWEQGTTVLIALSKAGGITERGANGRIKIIRLVNGERKEIKVKMTDLVQPNDTIEVPQRYF